MRPVVGLPLLAAAFAISSACATGVDTADPLGTGDVGNQGGKDAAADQGTGVDSSTGSDVASGNDTGAADTLGGGDTAEGGPTDSGNLTDTSPADTGGDGFSTCPGHGFSGALVTFDLSTQTGSETSAAATSAAAGVTGGAISRSAALTATSGAASINASNWGTGSSADATKYYTFTVTPAAGCTVSLTTMALDVKASTTGPANGDVATSADSFGVHSTAFAGTATPSVAIGVSGSSAIEIRIYGYGASASGGTFRVQNTLTLSGSIQ